MKKIKKFIKIVAFVSFIFMSLNSNAQISIGQNDMPNEGDTIRYSTSLDIGSINYSETGSNYTWDFSELIPISQSVDTFVSVFDAPLIYQAVFFLSSNLAKPLQSFDEIPGFQVTDPYEFYKNSSSEYKLVGYGVTLNSIPIPNKFEEADVIYQFPLNYENVDSSYSSYEYDIPSLGYLGGWKKRVNYADGWGTLITPFGTFQTLRVRSEIVQFDSIYLDSLGMGLPLTRNYTEYKWLGNDFGLPLCKVTDDDLLPPQIEYLDSVRYLFVGQPELASFKHTVQVFPNPAKEKLYFNSGQEIIKVELYNNAGNFLLTKKINSFEGSMDISTFSPGIYILRIYSENRIEYEKIIIE